jgi:putative transposase
MKCAFIHAERHTYTVRLLCSTLGVSHAAYYRWCVRQPSTRKQEDTKLLNVIRQSHKNSRKTYGSRRVHADVQELGIRCSRRRIQRLMQSDGLLAVRARKRVRTTDSRHEYPIAPNILNRDFACGPELNRRIAGDITYIRTLSGWLYLAVLLDLSSRRVIGWATSAKIDTDLVLDALRMALRTRVLQPGALHHSDRGSQYAATEYQKALEAHGIECSMSEKGECYDNAVIESFNGTIKRELLHRQKWANHEQATMAIGWYIDSWYNCSRRHSSLGYLSPVQFELRAQAGTLETARI